MSWAKFYLQKVLRAGKNISSCLFPGSSGEIYLMFAAYVLTSSYICSIYGQLDPFEHDSFHSNVVSKRSQVDHVQDNFFLSIGC